MFDLERFKFGPSSMSTFPSSYKFIDHEIGVNSDLTVYSRQTYDFFALMSDLGGLFGTLYLIASILISWYEKFNLSSFMISKLN